MKDDLSSVPVSKGQPPKEDILKKIDRILVVDAKWITTKPIEKTSP